MHHLTPEQRQFIEHNRPHYDTLIRAEFLTNMSNQVKDGLLEIAHIFSPGMAVNLWCGTCVCDLIKYVYTQVDKLPKWVDEVEKEQIVKHDRMGEDLIMSGSPNVHFATFPKHDEPEGENI